MSLLLPAGWVLQSVLGAGSLDERTRLAERDFQAGLKALERQDFESAVARMMRAERQGVRTRALYLALDDAYRGLGYREGRLDALKAARKHGDRGAHNALELCRVYLSLGRAEEARVAGREAVALDEKSYEAWLELGKACESAATQAGFAIAPAPPALAPPALPESEAAPTTPAVKGPGADMLRDAESAYHQARQITYTNEVKFRLARLARWQGKHSTADDLYRTLCEASPEYQEARLEYGLYLLDRADRGHRQAQIPEERHFADGVLEKARDHLAAAYQQTPENPAALEPYAVALALLGEHERAQRMFTHLAQTHPSRARPVYHLGLLALDQGDLDGAEALWKRLRVLGLRDVEARGFADLLGARVSQARREQRLSRGAPSGS